MSGLECYDFHRSERGLYVPNEAVPLDDLPVLEPTEARLNAKIEEFGRNYKTRQTRDGQTLSYSILNRRYVDERLKMVVATPNSSIEQNAGHVFETCLQAAIQPEEAIVVVDPPPRLTASERWHLRANGRFTYFDKDQKRIRGLPSFEAIGRFFSSLGLVPEYISGNHGAAHFEIAIALGLSPNTVKGFFANGPSIARPLRHGYDEAEDLKGIAKRKLAPERWMPSGERRTQVRSSLPDIYGGPIHRASLVSTWLHSALRDLSVYRPALAHNNLNTPRRHATLLDAAAMLNRHQEAVLTLQHSQGDKSQALDNYLLFGSLLCAAVQAPRVRVLVASGRRDSHTVNPLAWSQAEQWAFNYRSGSYGSIPAAQPDD